jgi:hypothetical protein
VIRPLVVLSVEVAHLQGPPTAKTARPARSLSPSLPSTQTASVVQFPLREPNAFGVLNQQLLRSKGVQINLLSLPRLLLLARSGFRMLALRNSKIFQY